MQPFGKMLGSSIQKQVYVLARHFVAIEEWENRNEYKEIKLCAL
jgi:hypothetical protein